MTDQRTPTKHQRAAEKQASILRAAQEEFGARGLTGAQVETIARGAGVTKALVYYYFGSKSELYEAVFEELSIKILEDLSKVYLDDMDPIQAISAFFGTIFDFYARTPLLVSLSFDHNLRSSEHPSRGRVHRSVFSMFDKQIDRAIAAGLRAQDTDKSQSFSFAMLILSGSFWGQDKYWGAHQSAERNGEQLSGQKTRVLTIIHAIIEITRYPFSPVALGDGTVIP